MDDLRPIDDSNFDPDPQQLQHNEFDMNPPPPPQQQQQQQQMPQQMFQQSLPYMDQMSDMKPDFFGTLSKTTYILVFVAFILGFFMGKTMQPVILRPM